MRWALALIVLAGTGGAAWYLYQQKQGEKSKKKDEMLFKSLREMGLDKDAAQDIVEGKFV